MTTPSTAARSQLGNGIRQHLDQNVLDWVLDLEPFGDASVLNTFLNHLLKAGYPDWFNVECANRGPWRRKLFRDVEATNIRFGQIWNRIQEMFDLGNITLLQFVALVSIMTREVGGAGYDLEPRAEFCGRGREGRPGLAYAFENIGGVKMSYQHAAGNVTAGRLFRNRDFIQAHGILVYGETVALDGLAGTTDPVWDGVVYPMDRHPSGRRFASTHPTSESMAVTGFIREADFYKFRGRGLIQTTGRGNYRRLIEIVQNYRGENSAIKRIRDDEAWQGNDLDKIATRSSNGQWDDLFMHPDYQLACLAVGVHNRGGGRYLDLSSNLGVLNDDRGAPGSILNVGRRINGNRYGQELRRGIVQIVEKMYLARSQG